MTRLPIADVPHPSVFIAEEAAARGWTSDDLALRLGGYNSLRVMALYMYFAVGPENSRCRMGKDMAEDLGRAFGVSPEYFLNLEAAWIAAQEATP